MYRRIHFPIRVYAVLGLVCLARCESQSSGQTLQVDRSVIVEGSADWDWTQARTTFVPGRPAMALTTMSRTAKVGSHGYHDVYVSISHDGGRNWSVPAVVPSLKRAQQDDGYEVVAGDLWPSWIAAKGQVLLTGKTFNFAGGTKENILREKVSYAIIDPIAVDCGPLKTVVMPKADHQGRPFIAPNAECHQPIVQSDEEVLLPIRYQKSSKQRNYTTIVARCRFDGSTLSYLEHG